MLSPGIHPEHWKRATEQMGKMQVVGTDIPLIPKPSSISRAERELGWSIAAARW
jgi:hypothetical protein